MTIERLFCLLRMDILVFASMSGFDAAASSMSACGLWAIWDDWEYEMIEVEIEEKYGQMLPISGTAILTNIEADFRVSAEMRKISETGVLLTLAAHVELPDRFSILIPEHRINVGCRVAWRHRDEVGVKFDRVICLPTGNLGSEG